MASSSAAGSSGSEGGGSSTGSGVRVYPLYRSKGGVLERDSGLKCLIRDVHQLLLARGVEPLPRAHVLENLQRLFASELQPTKGLYS